MAGGAAGRGQSGLPRADGGGEGRVERPLPALLQRLHREGPELGGVHPLFPDVGPVVEVRLGGGRGP